MVRGMQRDVTKEISAYQNKPIKITLRRLKDISMIFEIKKLKGACHVTEIYRNFNKRRGHLS